MTGNGIVGPNGQERAAPKNFQVEVPAIFEYEYGDAGLHEQADRMGVSVNDLDGGDDEQVEILMPIRINLTQVTASHPDTHDRPEGAHPGDHLGATVVMMADGLSYKIALPYPLWSELCSKLGFGAASLTNVEYPEFDWPDTQTWEDYLETSERADG